MRPRFAAALLLLVTACSSLRTDYEHVDDYDWSRLHSYAWLTPPSGDFPLGAVARKEIEACLAKKGYALAERGGDFLVAIHRDIEGVHGNTDLTYTWDTAPFVSRRVQKGSVILDVVDAASRKVIWRGTAQRSFAEDLTMEEREAMVVETLAELLSAFPPS